MNHGAEQRHQCTAMANGTKMDFIENPEGKKSPNVLKYRETPYAVWVKQRNLFFGTAGVHSSKAKHCHVAMEPTKILHQLH
jgi:hypothetical protein